MPNGDQEKLSELTADSSQTNADIYAGDYLSVAAWTGLAHHTALLVAMLPLSAPGQGLTVLFALKALI